MVVLELEFETANKSKVTLTIDNPTLPIDEQAVEAVMDLIIEKNIFEIKGSHIELKRGAQIVTRTVEDYPMM